MGRPAATSTTAMQRVRLIAEAAQAYLEVNRGVQIDREEMAALFDLIRKVDEQALLQPASKRSRS
jgi:hypothetical protein